MFKTVSTLVDHATGMSYNGKQFLDLQLPVQRTIGPQVYMASLTFRYDQQTILRN